MIRQRDAANTGFEPGVAGDFTLLDASCNEHTTPGVITAAAAAAGGVPAGFTGDVNVCTYDPVAEFGVVSPEDTRASVSARVTFRVGDNAEAYAMATYYQNDVFNTLGPQNIRQRMTPSTTGRDLQNGRGRQRSPICPSMCVRRAA